MYNRSKAVVIEISGEITLPSILRNKANLKEGDLLEVILEVDGTARLVPQHVANDSHVEEA